MYSELLRELKDLYAQQFVAKSDFEAVISKYPEYDPEKLRQKIGVKKKRARGGAKLLAWWGQRSEKQTEERLKRELGELYPYLYERKRLNTEFVQREQQKVYEVEGNRLDPAQIAAVVACEDAELILAPAGSGKSASLLAKLNYLTDTLKIPAEHILVIAFTNKVVAELKDRVGDLEIEIRTFHSLGNKILKSRYQGYTLISENETADFFRRAIFQACREDTMYRECLLAYVREAAQGGQPEDGIFGATKEINLEYAIKDLVDFFISVLGLQKSERIKLPELKTRFETIADPTDRAHALKFYDLYQPVYLEYEKFLRERRSYDFADMLNLATAFVETMPIGSFSYEYVLVDEAQDLSTSKYLLLKAILKKCRRAKLFAVGDDWQSIYRFAGSNLKVLDNFEQIFERETYRGLIELTYRFGQPTARLSNKFIQKNPHQSKKQVVPGVRRVTPIEVVFGESMGAKNNTSETFESFATRPPLTKKVHNVASGNPNLNLTAGRLGESVGALNQEMFNMRPPTDYEVVNQKLLSLYQEYGEDLFGKSLQIISRYNQDIYRVVNRETLEYQNVWLELADPTDISAGAILHWWLDLPVASGLTERRELLLPFCSMHKAKGITRDIVFVINMNDGNHGMPATRPDDPILSTMLAEIDPYPLAEERRLFYVAVTRAKERTILVSEAKRASDYVFEIEPDFSRSGYALCPKCKHGVLISRPRKGGGPDFHVCSNSKCKYLG